MSTSDKSADASFLSRWSRRKIEAKSEVPVEVDVGLIKASTGAPPGTKMPETPRSERTSASESRTMQELPAIETLTHEADFSPFMAKDVDPGMRNQAMKKLFADPHYQFEQMDKLDIYLDDYSKPDPIPPDMLRMMYQSKSLGLFDDEKEVEEAGVAAELEPPPVGDVPVDPTAADVTNELAAGVPEMERGDHQSLDPTVSRVGEKKPVQG